MNEPLRTCPICCTAHLAVTFERCDFFPVSECCGDCFGELREDDLDSREPECCSGGYCNVCTPGAGRWV